MEKNITKLTVFFDYPFWSCIYERFSDEGLEVCKIVFGSEPKDYEVYEYLLRNWSKLRFTKSFKTEHKEKEYINPKRMQRMIKKQLGPNGMGTKSQQVLKQQHEENKQERKSISRKEKEIEKVRKFEMRQKKRKEKHKGR